MKLGKYLTKKQMTSEAFAKRLQVSVSSVNKWRMDGYRVPRANIIREIRIATRGRVSLKDWY